MRPFVIISSTMSIDGRLASRDGFSELSCPYDKIRQHVLRSEVDAVMVGANTVRVDNPSLRLKYFKGKDPVRVIVSESGNLDPSYRVFQTPPTTILYTKADGPQLREFISRGVIVRRFGTVCDIITDLGEHFNVRKVMVEGGGKLNWALLREGCVDELRLTISPTIFGEGVNVFQGEGFPGKDAPRLVLENSYFCQCGKEIILKYKIK
jgi:2,5-diamino-6-(ribosylamino)-4(3H)-pyrimidinone 5'-phosphate reductase